MFGDVIVDIVAAPGVEVCDVIVDSVAVPGVEVDDEIVDIIVVPEVEVSDGIVDIAFVSGADNPLVEGMINNMDGFDVDDETDSIGLSVDISVATWISFVSSEVGAAAVAAVMETNMR